MRHLARVSVLHERYKPNQSAASDAGRQIAIARPLQPARLTVP